MMEYESRDRNVGQNVQQYRGQRRLFPAEAEMCEATGQPCVTETES